MVTTSGVTGGYQIDGNLILQASTTNSSTMVGYQAGQLLDVLSIKNTVIGHQAMSIASTSGGISPVQNVAVGYRALTDLTTGSNNTALGDGAGFNITAGTDNVGVGAHSLFTGDGSQNVCVGSLACNLGPGSNNTGLGYSALRRVTSGVNNIGIGALGGQTITTGSQNIAIGTQALDFVTSGTSNLGIGQYALYSESGSHSVGVGERSGQNASGGGNVFIGYNAGENETGANKLYIANSSTASPLIGGDFSAAIVSINGRVGISSSTPVANFVGSGPTAPGYINSPAGTSTRLISQSSTIVPVLSTQSTISHGGITFTKNQTI